MDLLRSLPIGLYLEQPLTWLHKLDPRVKLLWLLGFLLTPIAANPFWRLLLVGLLLLLTVAARIPFRVWRRQMGLIMVFSLLLFLVTMLAPDGVNVAHKPRLPPDELILSQATVAPGRAADPENDPLAIANLPQPTDYQYVLFDQGAVHITRRSVELAVRVGALMFTLIYSTNLYLLTTAPEEITAALDNLMQPLRRFNVPVTEIVLTLTLSLRFIPLVLEEVQNLIRSVRTRAINWKKLGLRGTSQVWIMVGEKLIDNLLLRAEQIASAMQVRGFTSPNRHRVRWHQFRLRSLDWFVVVGLVGFVVVRVVWGGT
ncbi:energy-coupling factor transporter transmembrane protein EcfT [Oculatella sp. LEGE 06141]|uniref:energy-coupling factor transporter transmembrane component T family protein n=1 Tax=Oculatella sp. LEGE 06141 TaxID=1828648 RepID=UPI00187DF882|nr:energy-coupling factor transporter transmembrane protein EcfT [Oculatella sp. LEGE 06141]MBE9181805.1 energy-coupling factor transporter transmembrane protein EcfT [Oculatella sp. LEGE 06141]